MKHHFAEYYPPSDEDFRDMWESGLIILDTNSILNMYRYSKRTREEFLDVIKKFEQRLWIPNQVGFEFHERRLTVIADQLEVIDRITKLLNEFTDKFRVIIKQSTEHSLIDIQKLDATFKKNISQIQKILQVQIGERSSLTSKYFEGIWEEVATLFDGKVGDPFTDSQLENIYKEGKERYDSARPPGYMDKAKDHPQKWGDLLIWKQILAKVSESPNPAIFITNDIKEDWWLEKRGQKIGPRPELVAEFMKSSDGKRIHFYTSEQFLSYSKANLKVSVSEDALKEVKEVSSQTYGRILDSDAALVPWDSLELLKNTDYPSQYLLPDQSLLSEAARNLFKMKLSYEDMLKSTNRGFLAEQANAAQGRYEELGKALWGNAYPSRRAKILRVRIQQLKVEKLKIEGENGDGSFGYQDSLEYKSIVVELDEAKGELDKLLGK